MVLGTSSKWRRAVFAKHFAKYGSDFMAADIDEKAIRRESPEEMTLAIAGAKADALLPRLVGREVLLVCMDQVVCCGDEVREKPVDEKEARAFLESYRSGKGATCVNGMVVHNTKTGKRVGATDLATVFWRPFPDAVIEHLIAKAEIFTSAGGFTVENPELKAYQDRLEGSIDSIEGLPVEPLRSMMLLAEAPPATHAIFDMDGLLLDTETSYTVAQQQILDRFGKTFTWELKAKMMGMNALDSCEVMIKAFDLQGKITAEDFLKEREVILDKLFAETRLMPGVERLLKHLHEQKVPMAVATSSHRRHFDLKTGRHQELFRLMHHIVTGDQVSKTKPDPEIFLEAARRFEGAVPEPQQILVFEDAPNGVQAGRAAGMQVCHVPDPNLGRESRGGAHCELRSLEAFRPEDWGLPGFPAAA